MSNDPLDHDHGHPPEPDPAPARSGPTAPGVEEPAAQALAEALRSSFSIVKVLMVALVAVFFISCIFTVKPNQVAVILRLGKPVGTGSEQLLKPGLHFALPYPIDEVVYIPVGESHTVTSTAGWYFTTPEEEASGQEPQPLPSLRPAVDGYTLTGDQNIIHVRVTLSYRIKPSEALDYAFNFANATNLLQHILDNALIYASARFNADDALYRNKAAFQEAVLSRVNDLITRLKLGITLEPREVRTSPPLYVRTAFDDVLKAQQQGDIKVRDAEGYANSATNKASGEASALVRNGITSSNYVMQTVAAEAQRFSDLLPRFRSDPELFKERLLAETMQTVLTNARFKAFLPQRADGQTRELRLMLNREPEVPKRATPNP